MLKEYGIEINGNLYEYRLGALLSAVNTAAESLRSQFKDAGIHDFWVEAGHMCIGDYDASRRENVKKCSLGWDGRGTATGIKGCPYFHISIGVAVEEDNANNDS